MAEWSKRDLLQGLHTYEGRQKEIDIGAAEEVGIKTKSHNKETSWAERQTIADDKEEYIPKIRLIEE
ncbi:hypothetical protein DPMN_155174 [Dreissena polymorpha]|uniref:Uncharacterized protein n=1 Tax=Dreissena polymorpha TaxID=45954 RepID=A0A9D4FRB6_DREPO|nr:hypothetical protein DPMN_155174 [Dreissena polymorpha]